MSAPTEFFLLTGFLGSGKTTLLVDFLGQAGAADTAVLVNDVGAIGIDGAIIAQSTDAALDMAMLSDGCVCCSIGNDLLFTIEALLARRAASGQGPFARIILECSGLSRPGPILRALGGLAAARMRVHVVTTCDCTAGPVATAHFEEAAAQLAAANLIVLTKPDRADSATIARTRAAMAALNPLAEILHDPDPRARALRALGRAPGTPSRPASAFEARAVAGLDHPRIAVLLARLPEAMLWADLSDWLENLAGLCGDRLLRVKGLVRVADCPDPLLLQGVGGSFDTPRRMPTAGSTGAGEAGLVIIARDLSPDELHDIAPDAGIRITRAAAATVSVSASACAEQQPFAAL